MSGWIKVDKDLETDPRFIRLTRHVRDRCVTGALPERCVASLTHGALVRFWVFVDTHVRADNTIDVGLDDIDELVGLSGFAVGLPDDWLIPLDTSTSEVPGYQEHNGVTAKKRALSQKRQENRRTRQVRDASVTGALLDQTKTKTKTRPEESRARKRASDSRTARPATRIPDDFELTDKRRLVAEAEKLPAERTFAKFRDYWVAASGAKARKHDWDATWRNWCRTEADRSRGNNGGSGAGKTKYDRMMDELDQDGVTDG